MAANHIPYFFFFSLSWLLLTVGFAADPYVFFDWTLSYIIAAPLGTKQQLRWDGGAGSLLINGTNYQLQQCHWHSDSEHTVDSRKFALEAHLVHQTQDNKIAVIGLVYNIGAPDPFLAELMPYIKSISNRQKEVPVGVVDPRRINIGGGEYYRYLGSLTTPPCTEGVVWTINKRVRTVSTEQVSQLRIAVEDSLLSNSRPLQPLYNRDVQLYSTKSRINHTN